MSAVPESTRIERCGVKVFCGEGAGIALVEFIPIFHRWIQSRAVPGTLIDVADYSHVPRGPGIILVAHEGIYGIDEGGGRRGLVYYQRRPSKAPPADALAEVTRAALTACRELAADAVVADRLDFRGEELLVFAHDRLHAPNTEATMHAFSPVLAGFVERLYPGVPCTLTREPDPKERFAVRITGSAPVAIPALLERLGS
jgi:hypothetical protein